MNIYIRATTSISPQETFGTLPFLSKPVTHHGNMLRAVEPDYKKILDPKLIRRMSRIIKMGTASATQCLRSAEENNPGAIITGTAYGCMEDTDLFLQRMLVQDEEQLSPTPFIQSTHNTVGAQVALMLGCHQYNNTFVHRGFSFESALLDATLLLRDGEITNVLVGSTDEITEVSQLILTRLGLYKRTPVSNFELLSSGSKGTVAGEGSAFFLLSSLPSENDYAQLEGMATFYKPKDDETTEHEITSFLQHQSTNVNDIDLIITGKNGDLKNDRRYEKLQAGLFRDAEVINYKHLCGEYPTSSSFALWLAAGIIKNGTVPAATGYHVSDKNKLRRILIYNNYLNIHHSLMLVSANR